MKRLAVLWLLLVVACSPFHQDSWSPAQAGLQVVEGVRFYPQQQRDDCGAAALASLLDFAGYRVDFEEIVARTYDPRLGGALLADLENYARTQGAVTATGRAELNCLRQRIAAGQPVVAVIETGSSLVRRPHYVVVFGYDAQRFLVHAGTAPGVFISSAEFERRWSALNRLYLTLE